MITFKTFLESAVDLEDKIRDYLMKGGKGKSRPEVTGLSLKNNMKKYDRHNELEVLVKNLITDGEIEFKLDGKKKVTRMKDFYKQNKNLARGFLTVHGEITLDIKKSRAIENDTLTIFTRKNTFKWIGG